MRNFLALGICLFSLNSFSMTQEEFENQCSQQSLDSIAKFIDEIGDKEINGQISEEASDTLVFAVWGLVLRADDCKDVSSDLRKVKKVLAEIEEN